MRRLAVTAALTALAPTAALAGPAVEVPSAFDVGDHLDLHLWLDYDVAWHKGAIQRERAGLDGTAGDDPLPVVKDLRFSGTRHTLTPRLELGFFTDIALTLALPVVLFDSRRLTLDDGVDRDGSTTIADGLLPATGYDADDPSGPGLASGTTLVRGVDRRGLDQLHLGLVWAAMNQARDKSKPTWKIGLEGRFAVGTVAKVDRLDPTAQRGVGRGVHEVRFWTSMAKRTRWAEPAFELWWLAAVAEQDGALFARPHPRYGARATAPMQRAGGRFTLEAIVWERPSEELRVGVIGAGSLEARFDGRDYSEMWEVFALAGEATGGGPLVVDGDPLTDGVQAQSHPGVSNIENYITLGGDLGVEARLGPRVRIAARFRYADEQGHLITYADAGVDRPTCTGGATTGCEITSNDVVDGGTDEVNPVHIPLIDAPGHRYRVEGSRTYGLGLEARVLF